MRSITRWFVTTLICMWSISLLAITNTSSGFVDFLTHEKVSLTLAIHAIASKSNPETKEDYEKRFQENEAMLALNQAKISSLESFLANEKKSQADYSLRIKQLQQISPTSGEQPGTQEKIERITTLNEINKRTVALINDNLMLAHQYQELLEKERQTLRFWQAKMRLDTALSAQKRQEERLNKDLELLFQNSLKLQTEAKTVSDFGSEYLFAARILLNNQLISLTQHKIAALHLQRKLLRADFMLLKTPDIRTLQKVTDVYRNAVTELSEMEQSLKKMQTLLKSEIPHVMDASLRREFNNLVRMIDGRIAGIAIEEQTLQEDLENHQQELKKQLAMRLNLSEYRLDSWPIIFQQLSRIPAQFGTYLKNLAFKVRDNYLWLDTLQAVLIWFSVLSTIFLFFALGRLLKRLTQSKERFRLTGHLYDRALILFSRNMPFFSAIGILFVVFYLNQIAYSNYELLFNIVFVWIIFRSIILVAWLALVYRVSDASGRDVRLYYRIKWLLVAGGWTTALMVVSYELPLSFLLQDLFNRLFMLFLVAVSILGWRSRALILQLIHPMLVSKKAYLRHALMLLLTLIPLTLFGIAMIGVVGYINLAWSLSRYQFQLLMVVTGYVVLRGLLFDALELLSEWMITKLKNGWLWIEVFLKPIDRIARILLLLLSLYVLSQIFEWRSDSLVITRLLQYGSYPLVNVSGIHITLFSITAFVVLMSIFIWMSKWTREFCFRWLYRDSSDAGIRNSLSVFTQYAVFLTGGFIAFRVLGLDFSGMSMILGGLAVGMGFGLRDFASNIVGGLTLLIERPVREGDLITLGDYEGRVAHIGIRTMRVSSWDNMEVLIPNAETFNKPFTNWTHQDGIVRTVVPIKVSRFDDPERVQQIILNVLYTISEILPDPEPQVFLKQIDEALIEFEARYFINVQIYSRFEIRSKVLFAIFAKFKEEGIHPPVPPFSVEITNSKQNEYLLPNDDTPQK